MSADEFISRSHRCPVCQTAFTHDQPIASELVGRDSDYRPIYGGRNPLPGQVLTCPTCRYSAFAEGFESQGELSDEEQVLLSDLGADGARAQTELPDDDEVDQLRRFVKRPEYFDGLARDGEPYGASRYVLAARCHEFLDDADQEGVANLYLRGSWCARASGERELELRCQREVLSRLRKRLDEKDDARKLPDAERPRALYLAAELSRRVGQFGAALSGFDELRGAVDADEDEGAEWMERARRLSALAAMQSAINAVWAEVELDDAEGE